MKKLDKKKVIRDLAKEHGLSYKEAREIINSQFQYYSNQLEAGDIETEQLNEVRIPYMGLFTFYESRVKYIKNKIKEAKIAKQEKYEQQRKEFSAILSRDS